MLPALIMAGLLCLLVIFSPRFRRLIALRIYRKEIGFLKDRLLDRPQAFEDLIENDQPIRQAYDRCCRLGISETRLQNLARQTIFKNQVEGDQT